MLWILLRGGVNRVQEEEAAHIIDDIGQPDPHTSLSNVYGPDEQSRLRLLVKQRHARHASG